MGISNMAKDLRERAGVLIEQWADGKFYIVKNRYSTYEEVGDKEVIQIHPNEIFKMMASHPDVVVVNYTSIKGYNHRPIIKVEKPSWMREARRSKQSNDDFDWDYDWGDD
ncbi:hypothetical protein AAXB25_14365 [Paenibacillus lautus]|uniref:hypothetical protein n=1 Tax=Paenibacillus lautus TaxID=1401 RepID=UPI003D270FA0